jgi:hypothetical protein
MGRPAALAWGLCALLVGGCDTTAVCGTGTHESEGRCVPDQIACGPGTQLEGNQCISVHYEL